MTDILWRFADMTPRRFASGEALMEEGRETGKLYVLKSGTVEVLRRKATVWKMRGQVHVGSDLAAEATLLSSIGRQP